MFRKRKLGTFLLALLGITLPVSAQPEAEQALQRGILAEESQGDLGQAERLYREALQRSASVQITTQGNLRLALVLMKLGKLDEAQHLLRETSGAPNEWGERARQLLGAGSERKPDDRIQARIDRAILRLQETNHDETSKAASSELTWIGERAAKALVDAMRRDALDLRFIGRGTMVLAQIGDGVLVDYLSTIASSDDESLLRTVISTFGYWYRQGAHENVVPLGNPELRNAFLPLLIHTSPRIREQAYTQLLPVLDRQFLERGLDDEDAGVRSALWKRLPERWSSLQQLDLRSNDAKAMHVASFLEFLTPLAIHAIERGESLESIEWLHGQLIMGGLRSQEQWELFKRVLTYQDGPRTLWTFPATREASMFSPRAAWFASWVREILSDKPSTQRSKPVEQVDMAIAACLSTWNVDDVPAVAEVLQLGLGMQTGFEWLAKHAGAHHLSALLPLFSGRIIGPLAGWMAEQDFLPTTFEPLLASIRKGLSSGSSIPPYNTTVLLSAWLHLDHPEVARAVAELTQTHDELAVRLITDVLAVHGDERFAETYAALLVRRAPVTPAQRNHLFGLCVRYGVTSAEPYLAAYAEGMKETPYRGIDITGTQWTFLYDAKTGERCHTGLSEADESRIVEHCILAHDQAGFDTLTIFPLRTTSGSVSGSATCFLRLPTWAKELLYRHADRIPWREAASVRRVSQSWTSYERHVYAMIQGVEAARREGVAEDVLTSFLSRCLQHPESEVAKVTLRGAIQHSRPQLVQDVIPLLQDEELERDAFEWLTRYPEVPEARQAVRACLDCENPTLRALAIASFAAREPERAAALIRPLLNDPVDHVRHVAASSLGHLLDKESIPKLVPLLRDSSDSVRDEARKALDAIGYYYDQKARWERWLRDENLGATSAADALIQQAKTGKTEEIRLAAIRSLGVLAVPETLPVLIEWMGSSDAKIAAAAREAVTMIHERSRK